MTSNTCGHGMPSYNFAALRYRHDVSTGEFVNVGLIMLIDGTTLRFEKERRYGRLSSFFADFDGALYRRVVDKLEARVRRLEKRLANGDLFESAPSFADLLAELCPGDSALTFSEAMGGVHEDPDTRFRELYDEYVCRHTRAVRRDERVTDDDIRAKVSDALQLAGIASQVEGEVELTAQGVTERFAGGWRNGRLHVYSPISFDLMKGHDVRERALRWSGVLYHLHEADAFSFVAVVAEPSRSPEAKAVFDEVMPALERAPGFRRRFSVDELDAFVDLVQRDLRHE